MRWHCGYVSKSGGPPKVTHLDWHYITTKAVIYLEFHIWHIPRSLCKLSEMNWATMDHSYMLYYIAWRQEHGGQGKLKKARVVRHFSIFIILSAVLIRSHQFVWFCQLEMLESELKIRCQDMDDEEDYSRHGLGSYSLWALWPWQRYILIHGFLHWPSPGKKVVPFKATS